MSTKPFKLSNKLLTTFVLTAILTVIVAAIGWLSFKKVASTQEAIIDEAIPAMDAVQSLARNNARMVASMSQLENLSEMGQITALESSLSTQIADMQILLNKLDQQGFDPRVDVISETVKAIHSSIQLQINKTRHRLEIRNRTSVIYRKNLAAAKSLLNLSETLVANASAAATSNVSSLYEVFDKPEHTDPYLALDRLIEVDIDSLERMSEIQLISIQMQGLLEQLESGFSSDSIEDIKRRFVSRLTILARRINDINDPQWRESGMSYYQTLSVAASSENLFSLYHDRQVLSEEIAGRPVSAVKGSWTKSQSGCVNDCTRSPGFQRRPWPSSALSIVR